MVFPILHNYLCGEENYTILDANWRNTTFTTLPHVTECVQHIELSWTPFFFLLIFCPIILYDLHKSVNARARSCSPVTLRIFICVFLVIDLTCSFLYNAWQYYNGFEDAYTYLMGDVPQYIGLCMALTLSIASRNRGLVTSGVLFIYWFLSVCCGFPEFRFLFAHYNDPLVNLNTFRSVLYIVAYVLIILQLILSCFADVPSATYAGKNECPEQASSFLNQITFSWFTGLAVKGNRKPLDRADLWDLNDCDKTQNLVPEFQKHFGPLQNDYQQKRREAGPGHELIEKEFPSVLIPLFKTYKWTFLSGALFKFIFDLLQFVAPHLLKQLITFIQDRSQPTWVGVTIALTMFLVALLQSMILHQYFHRMFTLGMNIRSVLTAAVYKKALSLSTNARKNRTVGEIVNLMSVDIQRFQDMTTFVMLFWSAPLQVGLSIYFLWRLLGVSVISGLVILILMVPFNSFISIKMRNCQVEQMKYKDERLKMMSEILNGIKVLKLYAWEKSMEKMVLEIRKKEIAVLRKLAFLNAATTLSWSCAPFLVAVLTFGVYVTIDPENNILTPQITFVALALFNILRFPLAIFAMIFSQAVQCVVSNKRLKAFFAEEEMAPAQLAARGTDDFAVKIEGGSFTWDTDTPAIQDIKLAIPRGSLVAVVGRVGSGKSSLLSAMLGEMNRVSGNVNINGSIAFVPQQAWIQNLPLRDNILFNKPMDRTYYEKVIEACALKPDLATLPAEDMTEIGEKGINLSGGQKQRVSLARACYSHCDIVLLDDPMSAVDAHVGKHIFEKVISSNGGLLQHTTRVFITHGLHYLKYCDQIIVMKDGMISDRGTYKELMASQGAFGEFLEEYLVEEAKHRARSVSFGEDAEDVNEILSEIEKLSPDKRRRIETQISQVHSSTESLNKPPLTPRAKSPVIELPPPKAVNGTVSPIAEEANGTTDEKKALLGAEASKKQTKGKLTEKEGMETGKVKWSVYTAYVKAIGYLISIIFFTVYVFASVLGVMSNLWLASWSDDAKKIQQSSNGSLETNTRLAIYAALGMGQAIFVCAASIIMALGMVRASRLLHEGFLKNILHSPMMFFDVTPLGRILNRFGKDIVVIDKELPDAIGQTLCFWGDVLIAYIIIFCVTPAATLPSILVLGINISFLDLDAVDQTIPGTIRSMLMTVFGVIATLYVIVYSTPAVAVPFALLTVVYLMVLDVEVLDSRLPSSVVIMVGALIQMCMILFVPIYATPHAALPIMPVTVFYILILDVDGLDTAIPRSLMAFVRTVVATAEIVLVILWATPASGAMLGSLAIFYLLILRFYVSTSRQLKRLESTTRSPIYSHFQESIQGASSIRAYNVVDKFVEESARRVDDNLSTYYPSIVANRWLAVRLELVGNLIVLFAALFAALFRESPGLSAGLVGLSVSYALNITQTLNWAVRMTSELETNIVAVERIKEYTETPTEGANSVKKPKDPNWPAQGTIDFKDLALRYRPGLDLVLKGITAHIDPGEKIGIVGRTGAGKSSLTLALFRIVEADGGLIQIDGENISDLALESLRSRLTIVPQDPVLFSGTLRVNLDPFNAFKDDEIWNALENAHLASFVSDLPEKLDHAITEGGENLSVGQRQLLCLARALLRSTKILILDEAAAAVDMETDALIQRTIREQFKHCTVLTIAHRLATVMDSDRLMVLDKGLIAEFDKPDTLLKNSNSVFHSMAKDAGMV